jgi:signal transduction histidine kinase
MSAFPQPEYNDPPAPRSRVESVLDRAPLAMLEVEGRGHVVSFVNEAACRLLDKTRAQLLGNPFAEAVPHGARCVAQLDRIYKTGTSENHAEPAALDTEASGWLYAMWPTLDAQQRPARLVIQLTKAPSPQIVAAMNEALLISGLRQHELREEAEKTNVRSQDEIALAKAAETALRDANNELLAAREIAERASKAKDDFLAALSHELRTPLTPVLLIAASLCQDERLPAEVREQLSMIERNVTLEARLIDDLLDLTKIAHGKLSLHSERCDAHSLIGLAIEIVREDARDKGIVIERTLTAHRSGLMADPARFQQVIWNLLRNSVKFTPRGGRITVSTREETTAEGQLWLRIEVADTGIGIEATALEGIFRSFDQGGLTGDHRFGGVGLGLAIARAVVVLHGGRISALSEGTNRGSTFVVELPGAIEPATGVIEIRPPCNIGNAGRAGPVKKTMPLRVLLVEDHENTLQALSMLLRRDGHHVITASTVANALALAATQPLDLVISDLGLPDGTGTELMEKLRADHGLRGIALSGYGMEDDLARTLDAGFVAHLVKPVSIADLRRAVVAVAGREVGA